MFTSVRYEYIALPVNTKVSWNFEWSTISYKKKIKNYFKKNEIVYWCCAVVFFSFLSIAYIKLYWNLKFNWNKLNKYFYYAYFDDCVLTFECMRIWTVHSKAGTVYNNNKFKFMLLYYIVHFYKKKINFL